ncbi:MAG: DUF2868 domain-containing protein [Thermodesulfobacteriota bacterium]
MGEEWSYSELIDLEYFLALDRDDDPAHQAQLRRRDRDFFLANFPDPDSSPPGRPVPTRPEASPAGDDQRHCPGPEEQKILKGWLGFRAGEELRDGNILPGRLFAEVYRLALFAALLAGGLSGIVMAAALLSYSGIRPVNVFVYLFCFVILQLFLLLLLPLSLAHANWSGPSGLKRHPFPLLSGLFASLLLKLFRRGCRSFKGSFSGSRRQSLEEIIGLLKGANRVYGRLFIWPAVIIGQLFGLMFQLGVILATLFQVLTRDLAFGWQSTLQLSDAAVFSFVRGVALPWSWLFGPGSGYPDLGQVTGSRIVLKDGIAGLLTADLSAWWPFLCLTVFFYALLPRILLLAGSRFFEQGDLRGLRLNHGKVASLLQRMRTPRLATAGRGPGRGKAERLEPAGPEPLPEEAAPPADSGPAAAGVTVLIPDDLFKQCRGPAYDHFLEIITGSLEKNRHRFGVDLDSDARLIAQLREEGVSGQPGVVILAEAWLPPITDTLDFLGRLRQALGDGVALLVGLVGKPEETIFTPPAATDLAIWRRRLNSLADPWLRVEPFPAEETEEK